MLHGQVVLVEDNNADFVHLCNVYHARCDWIPANLGASSYDRDSRILTSS